MNTAAVLLLQMAIAFALVFCGFFLTGKLADIPVPLAPSRRRALILAVVVMLAALVLLASRCAYTAVHGGTADITYVTVESAEVNSDVVHIKGSVNDSASLYRGYEADVVGGVMTVRLRYSLFGDGTGFFDERIPKQGKPVTRVILSDGQNRRQIYP